MSRLQCIVVTPEATVSDEPADFVALTLEDGEIGIAPGHTPLIGRLGDGELRIKCDDQVLRYYVQGGFVQVVGDAVAVLTHRAVPADQIDQEVAQEQLTSAMAGRAATPERMAVRDRAVGQARAQLRVARRSGG